MNFSTNFSTIARNVVVLLFFLNYIVKSHLSGVSVTIYTGTDQGLNLIAAIAVEGEQNDVDHCGNDGNFLPYSLIFILFTVHYYFDT